MNDNKIYPNTTEYYVPEDTATKAREAELDLVEAESGIIREFFDRLDERIKFFSSIDAIPEDIQGDEKKFMYHAGVNKLLVSVLREERAAFETLLDATTP